MASEVDEDAIRCSKRNHPEILQVGDVRSITEENLIAWGPFDLMGEFMSCWINQFFSCYTVAFTVIFVTHNTLPPTLLFPRTYLLPFF